MGIHSAPLCPFTACVSFCPANLRNTCFCNDLQLIKATDETITKVDVCGSNFVSMYCSTPECANVINLYLMKMYFKCYPHISQRIILSSESPSGVLMHR